MKKGFTLIELLAVIVILAIIALIASPIIIGLIEDARKESFKNGAYGIVKAGELLYSQDLLNEINEEVTFTYTDGVESSSVGGKALKYNGTKPKNGQVKVNIEGQVAIAIHNGTLCAEKGYDESEVTLTDKIEAECIIGSTEDLGYQDTTGAPRPELSDGMIPIKWDGTKWVKADTEQKWYDYSTKEWANVALVTDGTRTTYNNAVDGTEVLETDVLAYLVWIPRYKYKLFNVAAASIPSQTIEIEFESKNTSKSNGSTNGTWLTHPAFTFGSEELSGFWVGKFETTGTAATPTVKPGLVPLADQNVSVQFATSQKFSNTTTYGLTSVNDAHMMKNIEWGAVAYLTGSIYGKNAEVWVNPSTSYITGCAGTSVSVGNSGGCSHQYTSSNGQQASTTGNTYGIYGMSGGILERVMASVYGDSSNTTLMVSNSEFIQATIDSPAMSKYIDKYVFGETSTDQAAYNRRILGDATGETRGWYSDSAYLVAYDDFFGYYGFPWVGRGGYYNDTVGAGVFNFGTSDGAGYPYDGFRLVLK